MSTPRAVFPFNTLYELGMYHHSDDVAERRDDCVQQGVTGVHILRFFFTAAEWICV
jgi:hypothetical protein